MKLRVIHTTDGKYRGAVFVVEDASIGEINRVSARDFTPDTVDVDPEEMTVTARSSHYTIIAKIVEV